MFTDETRREIAAIARDLDVEPEALLAIAEVESGGKGFAIIGGRPEPLIRFEGHYFDRRLSAANRQRARADGLASPAAGAVANPRTQAGRWALLEKACAIDARAANESVSWGIGQVMGAHWAWLGYADVDALVAEVRGSIAGQIRLMARYIDKAGLSAAVRCRDWEAFARGYNGPQYRRHGYHRKIAAAYHRFRAVSGEPLPAPEKRDPAVRLVKAPATKPMLAKTSPARMPAAETRPARTPSVPPARRSLWSGLAARFSGFLGRG
jgi:hypothetical protein